ncbi:hypothetical protein [Clostridium sp. AWRP]|uniref:hypothetical protein n=1 Tax=Clostridium sp. AWRP TaxID=2212991 RepID=UPI000FD946FE|nr:hypothetical protein [Clostridium sp. AWRP]AZV56882.1 hypothetical protein DMR38_09900 [Clostridium sp. AWRP]
MKDKKISLRIWISAKIIPALLFLMYYWMSVSLTFKPIHTLIEYLLLGLTLVFLALLKGNSEIFDEFAKETLNKTDSICLKLSYLFMAGILLPSAFITPSGIMTGYLIAAGIVALTILRAIIFCVIDMRGI